MATAASHQTVTIRRALLDDAPFIRDLVNTAFREADSWFKKEEYHDRMHASEVEEMMAKDADQGGCGCFLAAESENGDIVGTIRLDWGEGNEKASFGMVSVPQRHGSRGIGSQLVKCAENELSAAGCTTIEMPVVVNRNERLIKWYEKKGYTRVREEPFGYPQICLPEYESSIKFLYMTKSI